MPERAVPELLSPAGGRRQLEAAINNGADAVYMGGSLFNARIKADNFTNDGLVEAIDFAHERGVKVYITLNTLIRDSELANAFEYAVFLYNTGADAVIVQDMGLARLIRRYMPDFPMHLSTQGTVYNKQALDLLRQIGFRRVVPARELSLNEICRICSAASDDGGKEKVEIEVFVHGALCMCYSGQCQMSRAFGGGTRSGNRGLCAQPCRLPYRDDKGVWGYFLSPKDICLLDMIPELAEAGVDSFKIEGRLKSAEYVAVTTRIYRKYIDMYTERGCVDIEEEDRRDLLQIFNRGGFTRGYYAGNPGKAILSGNTPKNCGIYVGKVIKPARETKRKNKILVDVKTAGEIEDKIKQGDGLEFRDICSVQTGKSYTGGIVTYLEQRKAHEIRIGDFDNDIKKGDHVYRVTDAALNEKAMSVSPKKIPVVIQFRAEEDKRPVLMMCEKAQRSTPYTDMKQMGKTVVIKAEDKAEMAERKPTTCERVTEQLLRLGDTPFKVECEEDINIKIEDGIVIPVSVINGMRREASRRLAEMKRYEAKTGRKDITAEVGSIVKKENIGSEDKMKALMARASHMPWGELVPVPVEKYMAGKERRGMIPYILNVSKGRLDSYIGENFDRIVDAVRETGILIGNMGWIKQFTEAGVKVYGDYGLNAYNGQSVKMYEELGVEMTNPSHETGLCDSRFDGKMPLMITEHPFESDYLTDRKGIRHNIVTIGDKQLIF